MSSDEEDSIYLHTISTVDSVVGGMGLEKIIVNGTKAVIKIDTGAEVNKPNRLLCGPDGNWLPEVGQVAVKLSLKEHTTVQIAYVLKNLSQRLLGLPAIRELGVISHVNDVTDSSIKDQYPLLFKGMGTFNRKYEIKLSTASSTSHCTHCFLTRTHKGQARAELN
uniref:Peptidase A2 domain-containing protein n=1 Tax=Amphimedon queenslandica TaxID=400682 RepID=A0A1X7UVQ1_AMPQE